MKITNPEKVDLEVTIKGIKYVLPAEGSLENVPEEHARYWQESLHKFIILRTEKPKVEVEKTIAVETVESSSPYIPTEEIVEKKDDEVKELEQIELEEVPIVEKKTTSKAKK